MNKIERIYMGMGTCNGHHCCISVAYNIDYCIKKALQFEVASRGFVKFLDINAIIVGETEKDSSISRVEAYKLHPEIFDCSCKERDENDYKKKADQTETENCAADDCSSPEERQGVVSEEEEKRYWGELT